MKILITRFSSIGDIVLTFPILRCLKIQVPSSEIHYATKIQFKELVTASEYIDRQYFLENSLKDLIKALRKEKYDLIIDLHNNLRTLQISSALGVKTLRFPKLNFKKWLLVNLKVNKMPNLHLVDRYFQAVKKLGVVNDSKNNTFSISAENEIDIKKANDILNNINIIHKKILLINPICYSHMSLSTEPSQFLTARYCYFPSWPL